MPKILSKKQLNPDVYEFIVDLPLVAAKAKPGQFVMVRINEFGERIPLTIADSDKEKGTITIVFFVVGRTSWELSNLKEGDEIKDIAGPLGTPMEIKNFGNIVILGGGLGVAPIYPEVKALFEAGNSLDIIIGFRTKNLIFWEDRFKKYGTLHLMTDDGSAGEKGLVTEKLQQLIKEKKIDRVIAIGPVPMMEAVANTTRESRIPTIVSLNPIMVDGTGMCGACRVSVGGKTYFGCVDGPEFDAHQVDFAELKQRLRAYCDQERYDYERVKSQ